MKKTSILAAALAAGMPSGAEVPNLSSSGLLGPVPQRNTPPRQSLRYGKREVSTKALRRAKQRARRTAQQEQRRLKKRRA